MKSNLHGGRGPRSAPSFASTTAGRTPEASPAFDPDGPVSETWLDNGVRILSERIPGVRSVSTGIWVRHGSAHDPEERSGASHMLEHMVFKGTHSRSARDIALALESLGGSLDAYTSREHTGFQARVLDEHLPHAFDVLSDLVLSPRLDAADLELEREVVLEEIAQVEDTPDDLVFEIHGERMWPGHPYGRSILGTPETVRAMSADGLRDVHSEAYRARSLVVAAAGNVEHDTLVRLAQERIGFLEPGVAPTPVSDPGPGTTGEGRIGRDTAQVHIVLGAALPGHADPARYALALLSTALGGGMSSRLFQRVREELGLCYSVHTYQSFYRSRGIGGVYVGTRPATEDAALQAIREELERVATGGLSAEELDRVKQQVKGQVMLSLESSGARLYRLTTTALNEEPFLDLDALLARLDAVTPDQIADLADRYFHPDRQLVLRLGPV